MKAAGRVFAGVVASINLRNQPFKTVGLEVFSKMLRPSIVQPSTLNSGGSRQKFQTITEPTTRGAERLSVESENLTTD